MAEKARTAQRGKAGQLKRPCPVCAEADTKVVQYTGFGQKKGFYWVCDSNSCDYIARTR
jgi:hypothetical protein